MHRCNTDLVADTTQSSLCSSYSSLPGHCHPDLALSYRSFQQKDKPNHASDRLGLLHSNRPLRLANAQSLAPLGLRGSSNLWPLLITLQTPILFQSLKQTHSHILSGFCFASFLCTILVQIRSCLAYEPRESRNKYIVAIIVTGTQQNCTRCRITKEVCENWRLLTWYIL